MTKLNNIWSELAANGKCLNMALRNEDHMMEIGQYGILRFNAIVSIWYGTEKRL